MLHNPFSYLYYLIEGYVKSQKQFMVNYSVKWKRLNFLLNSSTNYVSQADAGHLVAQGKTA